MGGGIETESLPRQTLGSKTLRKVDWAAAEGGTQGGGVLDNVSEVRRSQKLKLAGKRERGGLSLCYSGIAACASLLKKEYWEMDLLRTAVHEEKEVLVNHKGEEYTSLRDIVWLRRE